VGEKLISGTYYLDGAAIGVGKVNRSLTMVLAFDRSLNVRK
jgi:hypothetical protein